MSYEIHKNIKNLYCNVHTNKLNFEYYNNKIKTDVDISYFFLFECPMDAAFCHWVYESAILLPEYIELKNKYPTLKILVKKNPKRQYKILFFKALNIDFNDIYFLDNKENIPHDCKTMYKYIPCNNKCFVSKNIQCLNSTLDVNLLTELIKNFKNIVLTNLNINNEIKKCNEHIFFPRNKRENFTANDRTIDYIGVYKLLKNKGYVEYDTMNTDNLKNQFELLLSGKNIYLDWGSSFFVNGLFCKNSNIYISQCLTSQLSYNGMTTIYNLIKKNNNIIHLS